ncbi:MAG: nucleotidyltransferase [Alphaproteobacteria bacterium]|nr:MAG: nucleotidyltransferase [Alphaproteobacteria bacterium]
MNNTPTDIRWKQRFDNFQRAYHNLHEAVMLADARPLSKLEEQGLIQIFEYTHELAWKVLKDYLEEQGFTDVVGSKNATRIAFKEGLIQHGEVWMQMIEARNQTSHSYNIEIAATISQKIRTLYYAEFNEFVAFFQNLQDKNL